MNSNENKQNENNFGMSDEVLKLASRQCDSSITADEMERLEQILIGSPSLRQCYLDYLRLNADLMWLYRTGDSKADSAKPLALANESRTSQKRTRNFWRVGGVASVAAAFLLIAMTIPWLRKDPPPESETTVVQPGETTTVPSSQFIATLLDASTVVWTESGQAVDVGQRLGSGDVWIESGEAERLFDSGAKLVLSGPARLRLQSAFSAHLESGTLVAHMPESATGFKLSTSAADFIDQGTEFGVVAVENGPAEVHVFRGQVDVQAKRDSAAVELFNGEAMRVASSNSEGETIEFSRARFAGLDRRVSAPIQWSVADGGNNHFYQLVLLKRPITWHEAAADALGRFHHGLPGHLVTVTSPEEDQFLTRTVISESDIRGIWIGLTDVLHESDFRWITGEPFAYEKWASFPEQQPDDYHEAEWHGGEDYGMYTTSPNQQPWAWNDLSIDSIHEKVSAFIVEYEAPIEALKNHGMALEPIQWKVSDGGNGHHYQLVLSLESVDWETIRRQAADSKFGNVKGHLATLESPEEQDFVVQRILRFSGIAENMIGLSGDSESELKWITGQNFDGTHFGKPPLPTGQVYGLLFWDHKFGRWGVQTRSWHALPAAWFGYIVEYPEVP